jgi:N-acetyl-anhydromuramyl-L-alanine amidase AmpD
MWLGKTDINRGRIPTEIAGIRRKHFVPNNYAEKKYYRIMGLTKIAVTTFLIKIKLSLCLI